MKGEAGEAGKGGKPITGPGQNEVGEALTSDTEFKKCQTLSN